MDMNFAYNGPGDMDSPLPAPVQGSSQQGQDSDLGMSRQDHDSGFERPVDSGRSKSSSPLPMYANVPVTLDQVVSGKKKGDKKTKAGTIRTKVIATKDARDEIDEGVTQTSFEPGVVEGVVIESDKLEKGLEMGKGRGKGKGKAKGKEKSIVNDSEKDRINTEVNRKKIIGKSAERAEKDDENSNCTASTTVDVLKESSSGVTTDTMYFGEISVEISGSVSPILGANTTASKPKASKFSKNQQSKLKKQSSVTASSSNRSKSESDGTVSTAETWTGLQYTNGSNGNERKRLAILSMLQK